MTSMDFVYDAKEQVRGMVLAALKKAADAGALPETQLPDFVVEIPGDTSHGDFAANAAMVGARALRLPPVKIAQTLCEYLCFDGTFFASAEVAGPGFLNFFLRPQWFAQVLLGVGERGSLYGRTDYGKNEKVMVEFVSANPTGPMHMGNARGGALGDVLAAALDAAGYQVTKEFYINDSGNQIDKFGMSLDIRYRQLYKGEDAVAFPEDGYQGEDIKARAKEYADIHGDALLALDEAERRQKLVDYALPKNIQSLKDDLERYRIEYDVWFPESSLYQAGLVDQVVDRLRERGLANDKEGTVWYKATDFGGEKDEVLIRQNGNATYFAADIAYHYNKFAIRGFDRVINIWGADHHGHVARLKGSMDAVGLSGDKLDIVLMQLVRLMKDGEPYRMSKRSGRSVTLTDLLDEVPIDAARFFFNMNAPSSSMDFDLDLAVQESSDNPVYYVQYAHARICSILSRLKAEGVTPRDCTEAELLLLNTPEELALIRLLARYPGEIVAAAVGYNPAGLTHFATELANLFHKFYSACHVKGEAEPLMQARLYLCRCTKVTIANLLGLLKVQAPDSM